MDTSLRLAYRIVSSGPVVPGTYARTPGAADVQKKIASEIALIRRHPKFCLDNVARFYAEHDRQVWDMQDDIPNWAPPFQCFFAEWNEPSHWNVKDPPKYAGAGDAQIGLLVLSFKVEDESREMVDDWARFIGGLVGYPGPLQIDRSKLEGALKTSSWVLCCSFWVAQGAEPICGRPMWLGIYSFMFVSPAGRAEFWFATGPLFAGATDLDEWEASIWGPMHVLGLGVSFCHCKNVRIAESAEGRGERWHRRTKAPVMKFHTLDINPMREVLRTEGRLAECGISRAMHICRGHFATYTQESPLFGKYIGTFWRPDHVRGKASDGVVVKDYRVSAGG